MLLVPLYVPVVLVVAEVLLVVVLVFRAVLVVKLVVVPPLLLVVRDGPPSRDLVCINSDVLSLARVRSSAHKCERMSRACARLNVS